MRLAPCPRADLKVGAYGTIAATDRKIDTLVYVLYGLTDEEISIVEGSSGP